MTSRQREAPRQWQDNGFFGPGSPSWKIWTHPSAVIGFQRAVVLEHFDPPLTAAVADHAGMYRDPAGRLDRTFAYFLTVAIADGRTAIEASEMLLRVHAKMTGIEPLSGKRYNANNPASQLWIHITGWHSVLKCYEKYGPGKLSAEEENRFWAECAIAAELQTCDPADIPRNRAEVRDYFSAIRPRLGTSDRAREGMRYLLYTPREKGLDLWAGSRLTAPGAIATLPKWMREMGGFDQSSLLDRAAVPASKIGVRVTSSPRATLAVLRRLSPSSYRLLRQHFRGSRLSEATITPRRARELYGKSSAPAGAS